MRWKVRTEKGLRHATFELDDVTVDVWVNKAAQVVNMCLASKQGLDLRELQRSFKWETPLRMITEYDGRDGVWIAGTAPVVRPPVHLDDAFLEEVAKAYLAEGRGYSQVLAERYDVPERTVIRWVVLCRERGILTYPERKGAVGGEYVPRSRRDRPVRR